MGVFNLAQPQAAPPVRVDVWKQAYFRSLYSVAAQGGAAMAPYAERARQEVVRAGGIDPGQMLGPPTGLDPSYTATQVFVSGNNQFNFFGNTYDVDGLPQDVNIALQVPAGYRRRSIFMAGTITAAEDLPCPYVICSLCFVKGGVTVLLIPILIMPAVSLGDIPSTFYPHVVMGDELPFFERRVGKIRGIINSVSSGPIPTEISGDVIAIDCDTIMLTTGRSSAPDSDGQTSIFLGCMTGD